MGALDGAGLHGVQRLQAADDFAGGEGLDLELVVGRLGQIPCRVCAVPKIVSSDFGKLEVRRQRTSGMDWATAGAATVAAAVRPTPFKKLLLFRFVWS